MPRHFFAPSAVLEPLRARGLDALGAGVARVERWGAGLEAGAPWDELQFGSTRRLQLRQPVACLSCGEIAAASARRDRHGLPYLSCESCVTRTFYRTEHALRMALGMTFWLSTPGASEAWLTAYRQGQSTWKGWFALGRLEDGDLAVAKSAPALQEENR